MLRNAFSQARQKKKDQRKADLRRAILHYEARLGGELFGPVLKGGRREFFCLDKHTWVWHEEWTDELKQRHVVTTRYDVRPNGVVKSQGTNSYQALNLEEAQNLYQAVQLYEEQVISQLRRLAQAA